MSGQQEQVWKAGANVLENSLDGDETQQLYKGSTQRSDVMTEGMLGMQGMESPGGGMDLGGLDTEDGFGSPFTSSPVNSPPRSSTHASAATKGRVGHIAEIPSFRGPHTPSGGGTSGQDSHQQQQQQQHFAPPAHTAPDTKTVLALVEGFLLPSVDKSCPWRRGPSDKAVEVCMFTCIVCVCVSVCLSSLFPSLSRTNLSLSHLTSLPLHTSHLTPHTSLLTPHTSLLTPRISGPTFGPRPA